MERGQRRTGSREHGCRRTKRKSAISYLPRGHQHKTVKQEFSRSPPAWQRRPGGLRLPPADRHTQAEMLSKVRREVTGKEPHKRVTELINDLSSTRTKTFSSGALPDQPHRALPDQPHRSAGLKTKMKYKANSDCGRRMSSHLPVLG